MNDVLWTLYQDRDASRISFAMRDQDSGEISAVAFESEEAVRVFRADLHDGHNWSIGTMNTRQAAQWCRALIQHGVPRVFVDPESSSQPIKAMRILDFLVYVEGLSLE